MTSPTLAASIRKPRRRKAGLSSTDVEAVMGDDTTRGGVHRLSLYSREDPFTRVPNLSVRDSRLDLKARGLLLIMLSKPDGWRFSEARLAADAGVGRDALRTAMGTLIDAGYVVRYREGSPPVSRTVVYDVPPEHRGASYDLTPAGDADVPAEAPKSPSPAPKEPEGAVDPDDGFEGFWAAYPRHRRTRQRGGGGSRAESERLWKRMTSDEREEAVAAAARYAAYVRQPDAEFPAHAVTWLRQRRWEDWHEAVRGDTPDGPDRRDGLRGVM